MLINKKKKRDVTPVFSEIIRSLTQEERVNHIILT